MRNHAQELKALQGHWTMASLEVDGVALPRGAFEGAAIVVESDRFTSLSMGHTYEGHMEIDTAADPKSLVLHFDVGPEKGNKNRGIYRLKGDEWTICLSMTGGSAPTQFATKPKSGYALETLVRGNALAAREPEVSETVGAPVMAAESDTPELEGEWQMLSCVRDGEVLPESMVRTARRSASGGQMTVRFGKQIFTQARYTVDRSTEPPSINYVLTQGSEKGRTQRGIYELDGDILRICLSPIDSPRPSEYHSALGDGRTLARWKRIF